eukprot:15116566-Alexandrium_andersonii.AAC.1
MPSAKDEKEVEIAMEQAARKRESMQQRKQTYAHSTTNSQARKHACKHACMQTRRPENKMASTHSRPY